MKYCVYFKNKLFLIIINLDVSIKIIIMSKIEISHITKLFKLFLHYSFIHNIIIIHINI